MTRPYPLLLRLVSAALVLALALPAPHVSFRPAKLAGPSPAYAMRAVNAGQEESTQRAIRTRLEETNRREGAYSKPVLPALSRRGFLAICGLAAVTVSTMVAGGSPTQDLQRALQTAQEAVWDRLYQAEWGRPPPPWRIANDPDFLREVERLLAIWQTADDAWRSLTRRFAAGSATLEPLQAQHRKFFEEVKQWLTRQGVAVSVEYSPAAFDALVLEALVHQVAIKGVVLTSRAADTAGGPGGNFLTHHFKPGAVYQVRRVRPDGVVEIDRWLGAEPVSSFSTATAFIKSGTTFLIQPALTESVARERREQAQFAQQKEALTATTSFWGAESGFRGFAMTSEERRDRTRATEFAYLKLLFMNPWGIRDGTPTALSYEQETDLSNVAHEERHRQDHLSHEPTIQRMVRTAGYSTGIGPSALQQQMALQQMEIRGYLAGFRAAPRHFLRHLLRYSALLLQETLPTDMRSERGNVLALRAIFRAMVEEVLRQPTQYGVELRQNSPIPIENQAVAQLYQLGDITHPERTSRMTDVLERQFGIAPAPAWWQRPSTYAWGAAALLGVGGLAYWRSLRQVAAQQTGAAGVVSPAAPNAVNVVSKQPFETYVQGLALPTLAGIRPTQRVQVARAILRERRERGFFQDADNLARRLSGQVSPKITDPMWQALAASLDYQPPPAARPQGGLEEKPLNINTADADAILAVLTRLATERPTLPQDEPILRAMAKGIVAEREKRGAFQTETFLPRIYGKVPTLKNPAWDAVVSPPDPFRYGLTRRQFNQRLAFGFGALTLTAAGYGVYRWTRPPPGHLFWEFGYHEPEQIRRTIQRLTKVLQEYQHVILVLEQAPMSRAVLANADAALAARLRWPADVDDPMILNRLTQLLTNNVWQQPFRIRATIQRPQVMADIGHEVPLFQFLAQQTNVTLVVEHTPPEAQAASLKDDLFGKQAWSLLYEEGRWSDAYVAMVQARQQGRASSAQRDTAFAALLQPLLPVPVGTAVVIERGVDHRPVADQVVGPAGSTTITEPPVRVAVWGDAELEQWADQILRRAPLPASVEKALLGRFPWQGLVRARQRGGATVAQAREGATRLLGRVSVEEIRAMTHHLQTMMILQRQRGELATERQRGQFVEDEAIRWLVAKGYMRPSPAAPPKGGLEERTATPWVVGGLAAALGIWLAVLGSRSPPAPTPPPAPAASAPPVLTKPGHLFWELDYHGPEQTRRTVRRLQQALQDYQHVTFVFEEGSWDRYKLSRANPRLAAQLQQPADLDNPAVRAQIGQFVTNVVWQQAYKVRAAVGVPQLAAQIGRQLPLFQLLAQHPQIELLVEHTPPDAQALYLKADILNDQAWSLLYEDGRWADAYGALAQMRQYQSLERPKRAAAFADLVRPLIPVPAGTAVVVERGVDHRPEVGLVAAPLDVQTVTAAPTPSPSWSDAELDQWADRILRREPVPDAVERVLLGRFPWLQLVGAGEEAGLPSAQAMENATRVLNQLDVGAMRTMTRDLQTAWTPQHQRLGADIQRRRPAFFPFLQRETLAWLTSHGYLRQPPAAPPKGGPSTKLRTGLEEVPTPSAGDLEQWLAQLSTAPEPSRRLYGGLALLPDEERQAVVQTAARAYRVFNEHFRWTAEYMVQERERARSTISAKPEDGRLYRVTHVDVDIQDRRNALARAEFPQMAVLGEEGSVVVPNAKWRMVSDSVEGTEDYYGPTGRYLSLMTMFYEASDGRTYPILTIAVAPEYAFGDRPSTWLVAGLGIHGVLVNGRPTMAADRDLKDLIGDVSDLRGNESLNAWYVPALEKYARGSVKSHDSKAMFQIPLSLSDPALPGLLLIRPLRPWDGLSGWHLVEALGGAVMTLDGQRYHPAREILTPEAVFLDPQHLKRLPPMLYSVSERAAREILTYRPPTGGLEETARAAAGKMAVILVKPVDVVAPRLAEWLADTVIRTAGGLEEARAIAAQLERQGITAIHVITEQNFSIELDLALQAAGLEQSVRDRALEDLRALAFA